MAYDFTTLGNLQFEKMTQALALAETGFTLEIFGSGRDGGREATLTATPNTPGLPPTWSGHVVFQAKHKQAPHEDKRDVSWLISQAKEEFSAWGSGERTTRRPDYYVLMTNITLSPYPDVGGIDTSAEHIAQAASAIGIREVVIWHADKLTTLLDVHDGVRRSYFAWITSGDILSKLHTEGLIREESTRRALEAYLAKEVIRQKDVNLTQAGATSSGTVNDDDLPLSQVIIDLPITPERRLTASQRQRPLATQVVLERCARAYEKHIGFVLVGGPGQGKSTIGQWICQIHRAAILKDCDWIRDKPRVVSTVEAISEVAAEQSQCIRARRWPFHLRLTALADSLAKRSVSNITGFIATSISDETGQVVAASDIGVLLRSYPWLVVLDGLDEVPASSNREAVRKAVDEFLIDVAAQQADVVVLATTRPQGYSDRFSESDFQHLHLASLTGAEALRYGDRLIEARKLPPDRSRELRDRLRSALGEPRTRHLMQSPLQVAILMLLLDRLGSAPRDRYSLFSQYYRVIYDRELEKRTDGSSVLRDHEPVISELHAEIGYTLQVAGEKEGKTDSSLPWEEFTLVLDRILEGEGYSGRELKGLASQISNASTERLVLLTAGKQDEISFEIRSLQEFFAAEKLVNASDSAVSKSLEVIARSAYWSNVFHFAVGCIYFDTAKRHLRSEVSQMLMNMNLGYSSDQFADKVLLSGSRVATSILAQCGSLIAPNYRDTLLDISKRSATLPPSSNINTWCSALIESGLSSREIRAIVEDMAAGPEASAASAAVLAVRLAAENRSLSSLAEDISKRATPQLRSDLFTIAMHHSDIALLQHALSQGWTLSAPAPRSISTLLGREASRHIDGAPESLAESLVWLNINSSTERARDSHHIIEMGYLPIEDAPAWRAVRDSQPSGPWTLLKHAAEFSISPSSKNFIQALDAMIEHPGSCDGLSRILPWPLASIVQFGEDYSAVKEKYRSGVYSPCETWSGMQPETPWSSWGQALEFGSPLPLAGNPRFPFYTGRWYIAFGDEETRPRIVEEMLRSIRGVPDPAKAYLGMAASAILGDNTPPCTPTGRPTRNFRDAMLTALTRGWSPTHWIFSVCDNPLWYPLISQAGCVDTPVRWRSFTSKSDCGHRLWQAYLKNPQMPGLGRVAAETIGTVDAISEFLDLAGDYAPRIPHTYHAMEVAAGRSSLSLDLLPPETAKRGAWLQWIHTAPRGKDAGCVPHHTLSIIDKVSLWESMSLTELSMYTQSAAPRAGHLSDSYASSCRQLALEQSC